MTTVLVGTLARRMAAASSRIFLSLVTALLSRTPASLRVRAMSGFTYAPQITRGPKKSPFPLSSMPKCGSKSSGEWTSS